MDPSVIARSLIGCFSALVFAVTPCSGMASGLLRDAEIEHALHTYTAPIFDVAGIPPEDVRLLIVEDPSLNAFVAGGLNLFVHTGMIRASVTPEMLLGVLAHETGHIAGAHLSQLSESSSRATLGAVLGALVGVAAIAGGAGQAGAGVLIGSGQMSRNMFTSTIRMNEQAADQAAIQYLEACNIAPSGMLAMFELLRQQEAAHNIQKNPFLRDHPLTTERVATLRRAVEQSTVEESALPPEWREMHGRILAKIAGFMDPYARILQRYPESDHSVPARYARAIGNYRRGHMEEALAGINGLIQEHPKDPYFYDTKGQILFERGRLEEAAEAYQKAAQLDPDSALILTDYGRTLLAQEQPALLPRAIDLFEQALLKDDSYPLTWRSLAIAYGKQGNLGGSYLALAEEAILGGDARSALQHVQRARHYAAEDPILIRKIDDLEQSAKELRRAAR